MPEIAIAGFVGAIVVFICVNIYMYWTHRNFRSGKIFILQNNLFLADKYWSLEKSNIIPVMPGESLKALRKVDYRQAMRSFFIFGTFLIFLSWFGLIFFIIYLFSVHKLAKSRLEVKLFASELVSNVFKERESVDQILSQIIL